MRWPAAPLTPVTAVLGRGARAGKVPTPGIGSDSSVCADIIKMNAYTPVRGDLVAPSASGTAVSLRLGDRVTGDVVTGGGAVTGLDAGVYIGGRVDTSGSAAQLLQCAAAACWLERKQAELAALPVTPGFVLGPIRVGRATKELSLPSGDVVIDVPRIRLAGYATLRFVGDGSTRAVVRLERLSVNRDSHIQVVGMEPEQIVFVVRRSAGVGAYASVSGSILAQGRVRVGRGSRIDGGIFAGGRISVDAYASVNPHLFVGW